MMMMTRFVIPTFVYIHFYSCFFFGQITKIKEFIAKNSKNNNLFLFPGCRWSNWSHIGTSMRYPWPHLWQKCWLTSIKIFFIFKTTENHNTSKPTPVCKKKRIRRKTLKIPKFCVQKIKRTCSYFGPFHLLHNAPNYLVGCVIQKRRYTGVLVQNEKCS